MARPGGNPNLKPVFTKENAREMQRRGVEAKKRKREERMKMAETLDILLRKSKKKGKAIEALDIENIADAEGLNVDAQTAILVAAVQRAMLGDIQAIQFIRDSIGEKPTDKVEVDQSKTIEAWAKSHEVEL